MNAIPPDRTLDTVTPSEWNQATRAERERLIIQARANGVVAFCCLSCGFPLARGGDRCPACHSTPSFTPKQMDAIRSWGAMTNCPMCGSSIVIGCDHRAPLKDAMPRCATCRWWKRNSPARERITFGDCEIINGNVDLDEEDELVIVLGYDGGEREVSERFGCVQHEDKI